jgi:hypothetical protein
MFNASISFGDGDGEFAKELAIFNEAEQLNKQPPVPLPYFDRQQLLLSFNKDLMEDRKECAESDFGELVQASYQKTRITGIFVKHTYFLNFMVLKFAVFL